MRYDRLGGLDSVLCEGWSKYEVSGSREFGMGTHLAEMVDWLRVAA